VQHWIYVYELNKTLKDLIKFLVIDFKTTNHPLNSNTKPYIYELTTDMDTSSVKDKKEKWH